ncbi:AAC(3) family N-acetyltransferase [Streptomyces sp.]|uniref:AAC(3) family N-acetyltransferase n=1 Tax=Streptomyces sp. TaxID=1931 RepID=UPI0035C70D36
MANGARRRAEFGEPAVGDHGFPAVGEAFAARTGLCRTGSVGGARAVLPPLRPLVDFAARWFGAARSRTVRADG